MLFNRRLSLYILAGMLSALFGIIISQILTIDVLGQILKKIPQELIALPIVAICITVAMLGVEIYSSHPTRYKLKSFKRLFRHHLLRAISFGLFVGLISALVFWYLSNTDIDGLWIRVITWTLIGFCIGLGESLSWRWRSIEGQTSKANLRLKKNTLLSFVAGFLAAIFIEFLRQPVDLKAWEDIIGFLLLGFFIGAFLGVGTNPNYYAALRAGRGFEFYEKQPDQQLPKLQNKLLRFVTEDTADGEEMIIEEGLSIELPLPLKKTLTIGSIKGADIFIPNIPERCASISYKNGKYLIKCLVENKVQVNQYKKNSGEQTNLTHNQIITLYHANNNKKFYRFVFYDRFLDPQA